MVKKEHDVRLSWEHRLHLEIELDDLLSRSGPFDETDDVPLVMLFFEGNKGEFVLGPFSFSDEDSDIVNLAQVFVKLHYDLATDYKPGVS